MGRLSEAVNGARGRSVYLDNAGDAYSEYNYSREQLDQWNKGWSAMMVTIMQ